MKIQQIKITYLRKENPHAPDSSRLAGTDWVYDVGGQTVWVETDARLMHDWDIAEHQIKRQERFSKGKNG